MADPVLCPICAESAVPTLDADGAQRCSLCGSVIAPGAALARVGGTDATRSLTLLTVATGAAALLSFLYLTFLAMLSADLFGSGFRNSSIQPQHIAKALETGTAAAMIAMAAGWIIAGQSAIRRVPVWLIITGAAACGMAGVVQLGFMLLNLLGGNFNHSFYMALSTLFTVAYAIAPIALAWLIVCNAHRLGLPMLTRGAIAALGAASVLSVTELAVFVLTNPELILDRPPGTFNHLLYWFVGYMPLLRTTAWPVLFGLLLMVRDSMEDAEESPALPGAPAGDVDAAFQA